MSKFNEYLDKVKDLAEDAGEVAKNAVGEVTDRAKDLADERSKVRELMNDAKTQTSAFTQSAKEKVQGIIKDAGAIKEIKQGISELEALPEIEGSIVYRMDLEALIFDLRSLSLFIEDKRLDDDSVAEEITKVMEKVKPEAVTEQEDTEQQAITNARAIAYNACVRALETLQQKPDAGK